MTALREEAYDLFETNIVPFSAPMDPVTATPEAVKAAPDALLPPKNRAKPGPKKGSKRKPRVAKTSAPDVDVTVKPESPPTSTSTTSALNAAGTDGRRRYTVPDRLWFIGAIIASLAVGAGLAFAFAIR